jgi:site-specific DNA-cytosine methylase
VEWYGGLGAELHAVLAAGHKVNRYTYNDVGMQATRVAKHHEEQMRAAYPHLLSGRATRYAFTTWAMDAGDITLEQIEKVVDSSTGSLLVVAGFPCQDLSHAGSGAGWMGLDQASFTRCYACWDICSQQRNAVG